MDSLVPYFDSLGFFLPDHISPPEYFIDVLRGAEKSHASPPVDVAWLADMWLTEVREAAAAAAAGRDDDADDEGNGRYDRVYGDREGERESGGGRDGARAMTVMLCSASS